jgi:hypothetical protein
VKIASRHWPQTLQTVLTRVGEGLGVEDPIEAELYKLLVYDEGSFFVSHRDTEKSPGMFATLVIVLPSVCSGGELVVRHGGREVKLDMRAADSAEIAFAAFYADCVHEVLPVTSGCRLALVYNLVRRGKRGALAPPNHEREQAAAAALLGEWAGRGDMPKKIVYLLEHAYTQAELGFPTLKGADSAAAAILVEAAGRVGCDLHLALLTIEESGAAEYADTPRSRRDRWSEPELEAGEIFDSSRTLSQWRRPDGAPSPLDELPFEDDEISPSKALEEMNPTRSIFRSTRATRAPRSSAAIPGRRWFCGRAVGFSRSSTKAASARLCRFSPTWRSAGPRVGKTGARNCGAMRERSPRRCCELGRRRVPITVRMESRAPSQVFSGR